MEERFKITVKDRVTGAETSYLVPRTWRRVQLQF